MTRKEALLKLVALGPVCRDELHAITLWPFVDVHNAITELVREGMIAWAHFGIGGRLLVLTKRSEPLFRGWYVPYE